MTSSTDLLWAGDSQARVARWSCVLAITAPRKQRAPAAPGPLAKGAGTVRPVPAEVLASVEQTARDAKRMRSRLALRKLGDLVSQARILRLVSAGNPKAAVKSAAALARQIKIAAGEFVSASGAGSAARAAECDANSLNTVSASRSDDKGASPADTQTTSAAAAEKAVFAEVRASLSGLRGLVERAMQSEKDSRRRPTAARRAWHARHEIQNAEGAVNIAAAATGQGAAGVDMVV